MTSTHTAHAGLDIVRKRTFSTLPCFLLRHDGCRIERSFRLGVHAERDVRVHGGVVTRRLESAIDLNVFENERFPRRIMEIFFL